MLFPSRSPLQAALKQGLARGGDLAEALDELGEYPISTASDARAICDALKELVRRYSRAEEPDYEALEAAGRLFQDIEGPDCPAFPVLRDDGLPLLAQVVRKELEKPNRATADQTDDDVAATLFFLKLLGMYGTDDGADLVVKAARLPLTPQAYLWAVILGAYTLANPQSARALQLLSDPLPRDFIGVALLDAANAFFDAGGELRHPFDSDDGIARIRAWLAASDPDEFSYARSGASALAYLNHPEARRLLDVALAHPASSVRIAAARCAEALGDPRGAQELVRQCLDLGSSAEARRCLEEMGQEELVPEEALAPEFEARAAFAEWLAHPNELGHPPDSVDVVARRELVWPPDTEPRTVWVLRFHARANQPLDEDACDIGLVGSMTWCFFGDDMYRRTVDDVLAIHCCWELEQSDHLGFEAVAPESREYDSLLRQWAGPALEGACVQHVVEISPDLPCPRRFAGIAAARRDGVPGWVVLDGADSRWYPASHFPENETAEGVLRCHLGRRLLGFADDDAARVKALATPNPVPPRPPAEFAAAYESLLAQTAESVARDGVKSVDRLERLARRLDDYLNALRVAGVSDDGPRGIAVYGKLFEIVRRAAGVLGEDAWDAFSGAESMFPRYAEYLARNGRKGEAREMACFFEGRWDHASGMAWLGTAYLHLGDFEAAERFFLALQKRLADWHRCEEMGLLAEIWIDRGRRPQARALLLDCLRGVLTTARDALPVDRPLHENWYQAHRRSFLRLFPDDAGSLAAEGLPDSTLPPRT